MSWQNRQTFFLGLRSAGLAIVVLLSEPRREAGMVAADMDWVMGRGPRPPRRAAPWNCPVDPRHGGDPRSRS
ncbi:hypothetical protein GCM10018953_10670 [Streptosporangium nondiastaticum]